MNRTAWGSRNTNVLVRLTHILHMGELWDKIAESYKMIARLLDPKSDICACATDMENNDVMLYLQFLAFKLRYPGITSGNSTITEQCKSQIHDSQDSGLQDIVIERCRVTPSPRLGLKISWSPDG